MKKICCFKTDERTSKILSTFEEKGFNKSETIRKALCFYYECFDSEVWELLNRLQERSNLRTKRAVIMTALRVLEEFLNFEKGGDKVEK